jgi:hypothetical protein
MKLGPCSLEGAQSDSYELAAVSQNGERTFGDVAQLVERLLCKQDVRGSSPLISTMKTAPFME